MPYDMTIIKRIYERLGGVEWAWSKKRLYPGNDEIPMRHRLVPGDIEKMPIDAEKWRIEERYERNEANGFWHLKYADDHTAACLILDAGRRWLEAKQVYVTTAMGVTGLLYVHWQGLWLTGTGTWSKAFDEAQCWNSYEYPQALLAAIEAAEQTLALLDSVRHWYRHATGTAKPGEGIMGDECACCELVGMDCSCCPIVLRCGQKCFDLGGSACCEGGSVSTAYKPPSSGRRQ